MPTSRHALPPSRLAFGVACVLVVASPARGQTFDDIGPAIGFGTTSGSQSVHIGGGVSMVDLEGDGDLDLVFTQPGGSAGVAWQQADGTWQKQPNVLTPDTPPGNVLGHVPADVDGDGDIDVLVLRTGAPALLRNDSGTFVDVSATHLPGVIVPGPSGAAGDVDADGDVDFYLGGYLQGTTFPWHRCARNVLFIGDGTGRFIDRARALGVDDGGCALATAMVDIDDDGDLDLVAVNDFAMFVGPSRIFRNDGLDASTGEVRFTEMAGALSTPVYGMGVAFDDLDGDGRLDVMVSSIGRPAAMVRDAAGAFIDRSEPLGLAVRHGRSGLQVTWGLTFEDFDHDGALDAVAAGGHIPAAIFLESPPNASNVVWAGRPGGGFAVDPAGWSLPEGGQYVGRGLSRGDLDGDGRTDLAIAHSGLRVSVYRNGSPGSPTLRVRPTPRLTATADGTRIRATCLAASTSRQVVTGGTFGGAHAPEATISFPPDECPLGTTLDVWVRYPSGYTQRLTAVAGESIAPVEPDWLSIEKDGPALHVKAAPTGDDGAPLTSGVVITGGIGTTSFVLGAFEASLLEPGPAVSLEVEGRRWPLTRRVESSLPVASLESVPAQPRAGRPVTYRVTPAPSVPAVVDTFFVDGVPHPAQVLPGGVAVVDFDDAGEVGTSVIKAVAAGDVVAALTVDVAPTTSVEHTRVTVEAASVVGLLGKAKVRIEPCDEAGRCDLDASLVEFRVDGVPVTAAVQVLIGALEASVDVAGQAGALLEVVVADTTVASVTLREGLTGPAMAALVSAQTSRCAFSQGRAWADGFDRLTFLFDFRASDGQRLPVPPYWLDFPASGLTVVPGSVTVANYYGTASFIVGSGGAVGVVSPRVHGVPVGLTCTVPIVTPPNPGFAPAASALTVVPATLTPGQSAGVQFVPRTASGRLVGSALGAIVTTSLGTVSGPLSYDGKGAYTTTVKHDGEAGTATVAARVDDLETSDSVSATLTLASGDEVPDDADVMGPVPDVPAPDAQDPDAVEPDDVEPDAVEPDDVESGVLDTDDVDPNDEVAPSDGAEPDPTPPDTIGDTELVSDVVEPDGAGSLDGSSDDVIAVETDLESPGAEQERPSDADDVATETGAEPPTSGHDDVYEPGDSDGGGADVKVSPVPPVAPDGGCSVGSAAPDGLYAWPAVLSLLGLIGWRREGRLARSAGRLQTRRRSPWA